MEGVGGVIITRRPLIEVEEGKKQGPSWEGTFWGVGWRGGRKTAPAEVLQEIQELPSPENKGVRWCDRDFRILEGTSFGIS